MNATAIAHLANKAMLAKLTIKQWSAHKHDRSVTLEVARNYSVASTAGRYNKSLLEKSCLEEIKKLVGLGRQRHYHLTLPWTDDGARILPAKMFQKYTKELRTLKVQFDRAVSVFETGYPRYLEEARINLGMLFKDSDYPAPSGINLFFSFETEILPIPSGDDFRVSLGEGEVEIIRGDIEAKVKTATSQAQTALWERLRDMVSHTAERLSIYDRNGSGGKIKNPFRDSLVRNLQELIVLIPDLSLSDDPDLERIAQEVGEMADHDPQALRDNDSLRNETANKARSIQKKMGAFMGS